MLLGKMLVLVLTATATDPEEYPGEVACASCLPCVTPPCYWDPNDEGAGPDQPGYTSNLPGKVGHNHHAACWQQRANSPFRQRSHPFSDGRTPYAEGHTGSQCVCDEDYVEFEEFSMGRDDLEREIYATREWSHRFCGVSTAPGFTVNGRPPAGGTTQQMLCECQRRAHVRMLHRIVQPVDEV